MSKDIVLEPAGISTEFGTGATCGWLLPTAIERPPAGAAAGMVSVATTALPRGQGSALGSVLNVMDTCGEGGPSTIRSKWNLSPR
jgi:hypothetical protein